MNKLKLLKKLFKYDISTKELIKQKYKYNNLDMFYLRIVFRLFNNWLKYIILPLDIIALLIVYLELNILHNGIFSFIEGVIIVIICNLFDNIIFNKYMKTIK